MHLARAISSAVARTKRNVRQRIATLWNYAYRVQYKLGQYRLRYGAIAVSAVLLVLASASFLSPSLQPALEAHYATEDAVQALQRLLMNVGTALIGAAAIVTSLVLFAMQVNIERMPHGLRLCPSRRRQLFCAAWASLKTMASAVLLERHPLDRTVRCRTVANVLSMGLVVRRCFQCSAESRRTPASSRDP